MYLVFTMVVIGNHVHTHKGYTHTKKMYLPYTSLCVLYSLIAGANSNWETLVWPDSTMLMTKGIYMYSAVELVMSDTLKLHEVHHCKAYIIYNVM